VVRISPYDFRHCCATMMLAAGVAPGEAARRLGHSVEVLLGTYAGVMGGDEDTANARIAAALSV
jgi:integrase